MLIYAYNSYAKETIAIDSSGDGYVFCAVDITDSEYDKVEIDEIYCIDGRWFDCASIPFAHWSETGQSYIGAGFTVIDESQVDAQTKEALRRTIGYVTN